MTYSVASSLFKNYSPFIDLEEQSVIPYGKLLVHQQDRQLAVMDLYGEVRLLGNSKRYLKDLEGYVDVGNTQGLLQFTVINGDIALTTAPLRISLWNLEGTALPLSVVNTYLGLNNDLLLSAIPEYIFSIKELADVSNYTESAQQDGWVLTSNYYNGTLNRPNSVIPKDPAYRTIHAYWNLQPEASAIRYFDDASRQPERDKQVYRIPKPNENASHLYVNYDLTIAFDPLPRLSNHLDASQLNIFNQQYLTTQSSVSNSVVTLSIDLESQQVTIFDASSARLVNLDINVPVTDSPSMYNHCLILQNFNGELGLPVGTYLENGTSPVSLGGDVLLSIIATNYPITKICILQKTLQAL